MNVTNNANRGKEILGRETTANLSKEGHHGKATKKRKGWRTEAEVELTKACAAAV
jgi:hypothetical protein